MVFLASGPKINRRQVLAGGAAVSVAAASLTIGSEAQARPDRVVPQLAILADGLQSQAVLAAALAARVSRVERFRGDIAAPWFDRLARSPTAFSSPMVGLTSVGSMFCAEELGAPHGLRLLAAIYLEAPETSVAGDEAWLRDLLRTDRPAANAALALADGVPAVPAGGAPAERFARGGRDKVVAWIMAPGVNRTGSAKKFRPERI